LKPSPKRFIHFLHSFPSFISFIHFLPSFLPSLIYSQRAGEARALVRLSRGLDRPGLLGFISFVLPIILDGIFHKAAPRMFGPNTIALLQRDGITFTEVANKKRRDRLLQVALLGGIVYGATRASWAVGDLALNVLLPASTTAPQKVLRVLVFAAAALAANAARGALSKAEHMAPADAMAKQPKGGFSDNNSSIMMKERLSQPGAGEPERAQ
jgi:hypothetical protein